MIKADKLKIGDTIGLVAPSSPVDEKKLEKLIKVLKSFGFKVKLGKSPGSDIGYLAGDDETRAKDIEEMFKDDQVKAILCVRGGYGSPRLLDKIDINIIKENPKIFIGYSDITALHVYFNQKAKLITFHGPMGVSNMAEDFDEFSKSHMAKVLMEDFDEILLENPEGEEITVITPGEATGQLIGGNLSLIVDIMATDYEIDYKGKILFIEEIDEEPYNIDRMLNQLRLAGVFEKLSGIILGDFNNCEYEKDRVKLIDLLKEYFGHLDIPVIYNLQAGHTDPMLTLALGAEVRMENDKVWMKAGVK